MFSYNLDPVKYPITFHKVLQGILERQGLQVRAQHSINLPKLKILLSSSKPKLFYLIANISDVLYLQKTSKHVDRCRAFSYSAHAESVLDIVQS